MPAMGPRALTDVRFRRRNLYRSERSAGTGSFVDDGPMDKSRQAVAGTGLLVAAIRAKESTREDRLFTDPYADKLAGDTGRALLEAAIADAGERSTIQIVVRTRFWDEALLRAAAVASQVVILAAGMDARAYRLEWPAGTTVYELDQRAVIAAKNDLLAADEPRCRRVAIGVDLTDDWPVALTDAGFDSTAPTVWLIEGLLQYLDEREVWTLFDRVNELSAPRSTVCYDVVGKSLLESATMAPLLKSMAEHGSPWLFGTDDPGELAERHGWTSVVTDIAEPGKKWNRWFGPQAAGADVPRGYFVEATLP
jgi:methyltransferase (TIGR00027 family)